MSNTDYQTVVKIFSEIFRDAHYQAIKFMEEIIYYNTELKKKIGVDDDIKMYALKLFKKAQPYQQVEILEDVFKFKM